MKIQAGKENMEHFLLIVHEHKSLEKATLNEIRQTD